jgi:hypothetical protein
VLSETRPIVLSKDHLHSVYQGSTGEPYRCPRIDDDKTFAPVEVDRGGVLCIYMQGHARHPQFTCIARGVLEQCTPDALSSSGRADSQGVDVPLTLVVTPHEGIDGHPGEGHCCGSKPGPPPRQILE